MRFEVVWFDSMGAKSSCIMVYTDPVNILIDPGAAAMQPSYPLPADEKISLLEEAYERIFSFLERADVVIITHYHHDHYIPPNEAYRGKLLLIKDPNRWINNSQHERAREFLRGLLDDEYSEEEPGQADYPDPVEPLSEAMSRDFGDYSGRRRELLEKGREWFRKMAELWSTKPWVRETGWVRFADGLKFEFDGVKVKFSEPLFHGIEFDRTGWVLSVLVDDGRERLLYSSDLMGPQIEDYATRIIRERPDAIILDGPPIYLFPYMMNRVNLGRAVENAARIVRESGARLVIYDHHLMRKKGYMKYVGKVYEEGRRAGTKVLAASELLGRKPLIDSL